MRILIGHNYYQIPGGEDTVFKTESALLKDFGQDVALYERHNAEFGQFLSLRQILNFSEFYQSQTTYREIKVILEQFKPDVAHFHNIFYGITPAAYYACKDKGVPVVQTLHNFRLLCANGLLYRDHRVCEDCLNKSLWQGLIHKCYRNSYSASALMVSILKKHWQEKTWSNMVDVYIALSEFSRTKFIQGGIPSEKIVVKPNTLYPEQKLTDAKRKDYALYAGRLSEEKGVEVLVKAWAVISKFPLKILGDGPLRSRLENYVRQHHLDHVELLGFADQGKCRQYIQEARFVVIPSTCYENFPRTAAEAFACGTPLLVSQAGSLSEIVNEGETGSFFEAGNPDDLARRAMWLIEHSEESIRMGKNARKVYEEKYSADQSHRQLMSIYERAMSVSRKK